jgi:adenine-specific DNA-methyltransferase
MSSSVKALLARVPDEALRAELAAAIAEANSTTEFGLVFEKHLPETVRLPHHPVRRGVKAGLRDVVGDRSVFEVVGISDGETRLIRRNNADGTAVDRSDGVEITQEALDKLVVVAEFGDPIYPGLRRLGSISRGGDKPAHVVINAENHHALEMLRFTHAGKVDCIYIDPPYNSGARDWKYDNDYVDADDAYRHSKWLAFMDRRLRLVKELLNPDDSVLIVTIDEREVHRLGLLLEQTFAGVRTQMVSSVINPAGTGRQNEFSRTNEYIFFLQFGSLVVQPMLPTTASEVAVEWEPFRRRDLASRRGTLKGGRSQFYPIYVDRTSGLVVGTGAPLRHDQDRGTAPERDGCASVFPVREDGTEMNWSLTREEFERRLANGYVRVGRHQPNGPQEYVISYLRTGPIADIEAGRAVVASRNADGSVIAKYPEGKRRMPLTQWDLPSHDAQRYGTTLLQSFIPGRRFPFPKSLYAVEDVLRIAVGHKAEAVVLDYFAGSGTTAHATARLNRQDGGRRQSISVTNNEVSVEEARSLISNGLRDGDPEWEALGIFEHITHPRITAAIMGVTPDGEPVRGEYRFTDEFPMAEGFEENVEFLELTYQDIARIGLDLAFNAIAPMLWLRAGGQGPVIEDGLDEAGRRRAYQWTDRYGVLFDTDHWSRFVADMPESAVAAFIVTDSTTTFAQVSGELPGHVDTVRLYERYLTTFAINTGEA